MQTKIDWLSFTLPTPVEPSISTDIFEIARQLSNRHLKEKNLVIFNGTGFEIGGGRAPYRYSMERADRGVRVFAGSNTGTILFEITGRACAVFEQLVDAKDFIALIARNITRIDVATDIECSVDPEEFTDQRSIQRFKSTSVIRSATGTTSYVGSPASDRFARVYRFSEPHPRSASLRVECVFRRNLARSAGHAVLDAASWGELAQRTAASYGWQHPVWDVKNEAALAIKAPHNTQQEAGTVSWLYTQVAPAIRRLMKSGAFDLTEWLLYIQEETIQSLDTE